MFTSPPLISKYAGRAHNIVVAERVVLNFMQRMSGIATLTKVFNLLSLSLSMHTGQMHDEGLHMIIFQFGYLLLENDEKICEI